MGSLYRSQHELLPLFKNGTAPHVNNIELGKKGRWRSSVWTLSRRLFARLGRAPGPPEPSDGQPTVMIEDARSSTSPTVAISCWTRSSARVDPHRRRENRPHLPRCRARFALRRCHRAPLRGGQWGGGGPRRDRRELPRVDGATCGRCVEVRVSWGVSPAHKMTRDIIN